MIQQCNAFRVDTVSLPPSPDIPDRVVKWSRALLARKSHFSAAIRNVLTFPELYKSLVITPQFRPYLGPVTQLQLVCLLLQRFWQSFALECREYGRFGRCNDANSPIKSFSSRFWPPSQERSMSTVFTTMPTWDLASGTTDCAPVSALSTMLQPRPPGHSRNPLTDLQVCRWAFCRDINVWTKSSHSGCRVCLREWMCVCEGGLIHFQGTVKCERCNYAASSSDERGRHIHTSAPLAQEVRLNIEG